MNVYKMLAYDGVRTFVGPWVTFAFRINSEGKENIPEEGGALLVCNRHSVLDSLALMTEVDRYIHFVTGSRNFVVPTLKTLYQMTGVERVVHRGGTAGAKGLDQAVRLLKDGNIVGIFPEGIEPMVRPDKTAKISYFRTDFARIAIEAGSPVIPAAVIPGDEIKYPLGPGKLMGTDTKRSLQKDGPLKSMMYRKVLVRIGRPITFNGFLTEPINKTSIDALSSKIRQVVVKLYKGEDLDRFLTGQIPFDAYTDRV